MSTRSRAFDVISTSLIALTFFGLGAYSAQQPSVRRTVRIQSEIGALRGEMDAMRRRGGSVGTGGVQLQEKPTSTAAERASGTGVPQLRGQPPGPAGDDRIVAQIKRQLQTEMGLFPLQLLRDRHDSFVEVHARDASRKVHYGTAGYLGGGFFITVKHGVVALGKNRQQIQSIEIFYRERAVQAKLVDTGDADVEVHPGDWANKQSYIHPKLTRRSRKAFPVTDIQLKLMAAAAAMIGLSSKPRNGSRTPAAIGTPKALYPKAKNQFGLIFPEVARVNRLIWMIPRRLPFTSVTPVRTLAT